MPTDLAPDLPLSAAPPVFMPLRALAAHITATRFQVSHRTLERWPLKIRVINGRRHAETAHALAHADKMISAAPPVMIGSALHGTRRRLALARITS
jgi:hypothetical protein